MNFTPRRFALAMAASAFAALLVACGGSDPQKLVASAKAYMAKGELRPAVIELKTAIQQAPDSAEARFLLGKALLASEEPVGAAVELRKALELKHPRELVSPELATAMLDLGLSKEVIAQFSEAKLDDKAALAGLRTAVGQAHARSGAGDAAIAAFKAALQAQQDHVPAQNGIARQAAVNGDREAAFKAVAEIVAAGKPDADTWVLQGDLQIFGKNDKAGAIAAYTKALAIAKDHLPAHAGIIQLQVGTADTAGAVAQVTELAKLRPAHSTTRFFQAQVAYLQGHHKAAKELVLALLKAAPDHPQLNQLAGAIELALGSTEEARAYLSKALKAAPGSIVARRLLTNSLLRAGEPDKALEILQPALAQAAPDGVALSVAGEAYMHLGELEKASAMFALAAKANPGNTDNLTALARTRFLKGDAEGAVADLQQISASDSGTVADLELVNTNLRRRDFQAALKAIDTLERKQPGKALNSLLRGVSYRGIKDLAQARASFSMALTIDPTYFPAAFNLAALDLADKKPQAAQERFEAVLKAQPSNLRALLALADLRARNGAKPQEITDLLTIGVRLNPAEAAAHLAVIDNHLVNKRPDAAMAAAQQADAALPGKPVLLDALARAQQAAGQHQQAITTYNRISALQPGNPLAHMRIAERKIAAKDQAAAIESLKRAVAANPNAAMPLRRLFGMELQAGRHADALKLGRDEQKRQPGNSLGHIFEGDVLRAQKNDAAALAAYKTALSKTAPEMAAPRYHSQLVAMGSKAEADRFASSWTKERAQDLGFTIYLGDNALARKDYAGAEAAYRLVIERQPNHVAWLNNVAWLMARAKKPGALTFAEKANELQPNQPALMDTLAVALAAEGSMPFRVERDSLIWPGRARTDEPADA